MTILVSKYSNGKASLGCAKVTIDTVTYEFPTVTLIVAYTKQQPSAVTFKDILVVRTNNVSNSHNVASQTVGSKALYVGSKTTLTDTNFPTSPSLGTIITAPTVLPGTAVDISGGGSGKTRIVGFENTDNVSAHNVVLTIDSDQYTITLNPLGKMAILLVDTPSTDRISVYDQTNSTKIKYFVVETNTANANTDSYTRTYEERDSNNNLIDTGSESGSFRWFNVGASSVSSSVIGGALM